MRIKKIEYSSHNHYACDITPKRIAQKYELEIYIHGEGTSYIDGKTYAHSDNKIIFAKPGQERFSIGEFQCYAIHFYCNDEELGEALAKIPDCCFVTLQTRNELIKYYEMIHETNSIKSYAAFFNIIELISQEYTVLGSGLIPMAEVAAVKEYIDAHFTTSIDFAQLSQEVHLSPNYLRKKFLEAYGTTIQKYIIDMRLGMVKKLLLTTNKSLSEIAYASGFNSQSHMNVMFRSSFAMTPLEYKNNTVSQMYNLRSQI